MIFVFNMTEDGVNGKRMTEEDFLKKLNQQDYGKNPKFLTKDDFVDIYDGSWPIGLVVIRGEIVQPKPKQVVIEFTL